MSTPSEQLIEQPDTPKHCRNCSYIISDTYCPNCGQKSDVGRLSWGSLAESLLATVVGDGAIGDRLSNVRYGLTLTLWSVMTRPGLIISEYLDGRRRKYFNPVTILLLLSGLYALIGVFFGIVSDTPQPADTPIGTYFNLFFTYCKSHPGVTALMLLPFMALAYKWVLGRRSSLKYIEFAYLGIFGALFSVTLLFLQLPFRTQLLETYSNWAEWIAFIAQGWFVVVVFKRLFHTSIKRSVWYWLLTTVLAYASMIIAITLLLCIATGAYYAIDPEGFQQGVAAFTNRYIEDPDTAQSASDALRGVDSLRVK